MTPRRRVTDHPHGPEMVQLALDNLRARFPIAFSARDVQPVSARGLEMRMRCMCGSSAVVVMTEDVGGEHERHALCFPHADKVLDRVMPETTRDRSEYVVDWGRE